MKSVIEGAERCPQCFKAPELKTDYKGSFELRCDYHGHVATGDTLEMVVKHWNKYIQFVTHGAA